MAWVALLLHALRRLASSLALVSSCAVCVHPGAEQLVGGVCVSGGLPCDDEDECTEDRCDEQFGTCLHTLSNSSQPDCTAAVCGGPRCVPLCPPNSQFGSDGWSVAHPPHPISAALAWASKL